MKTLLAVLVVLLFASSLEGNEEQKKWMQKVLKEAFSHLDPPGELMLPVHINADGWYSYDYVKYYDVNVKAFYTLLSRLETIKVTNCKFGSNATVHTFSCDFNIPSITLQLPILILDVNFTRHTYMVTSSKGLNGTISIDNKFKDTKKWNTKSYGVQPIHFNFPKFPGRLQAPQSSYVNLVNWYGQNVTFTDPFTKQTKTAVNNSVWHYSEDFPTNAINNIPLFKSGNKEQKKWMQKVLKKAFSHLNPPGELMLPVHINADGWYSYDYVKYYDVNVKAFYTLLSGLETIRVTDCQFGSNATVHTFSCHFNIPSITLQLPILILDVNFTRHTYMVTSSKGLNGTISIDNKFKDTKKWDTKIYGVQPIHFNFPKFPGRLQAPQSSYVNLVNWYGQNATFTDPFTKQTKTAVNDSVWHHSEDFPTKA